MSTALKNWAAGLGNTEKEKKREKTETKEGRRLTGVVVFVRAGCVRLTKVLGRTAIVPTSIRAREKEKED